MKKYVFFTSGIGGLSGNPRYLDAKCEFLISNGWEVCIYSFYSKEPVVLPQLVPFEKYIIPELEYYPLWYTRRKRNHIINRIINDLNSGNDIVLESNTMTMSMWGEIIASKIKAKHVIYLTDENVFLDNEKAFSFIDFKIKQKEFYTISPARANLFLSKYAKLDNPYSLFWSASSDVKVSNYPFPPFDTLPKADYTICHFGRYKDYFPLMLNGIREFCECYQDKSFNIFFLGNCSGKENYIKTLLSCKNMNLTLCEPVLIVPECIFSKSDVIFSTAGCAWLAHENGGKVVSIDINDSLPLGLFGYTTFDSNVYSGRYKKSNKSYKDWLEELLLGYYNYSPLEAPEFEDYSFKYQLSCIERIENLQYFDTSKVYLRVTNYDNIAKLLMKLRLYKLAYSIHSHLHP